MKTLITVFGFNRPEKLQSVLESLSLCDEASRLPVRIFIDGPRYERDVELVDSSIAVAKDFIKDNWSLDLSARNYGCRGAIPRGLTSISEDYDSVIVLEDDMLLSRSALNYFLDGLSRFANCERVWSICGYGFHSTKLSRENKAYFLPHFHPWGWATWTAKWKTFDLYQDDILSEDMSLSHLKSSFNAFGLSNSMELMDLEQRQLVDCWDVRWHRHIFDQGGLCLYPSRNYINNTGYADGTHGSAINPTRLLIGPKIPLNEELPLWPKEVSVDFEALDLAIRGREAWAQRLIAKGGRVKRTVLKGMKFWPLA